MISKISRGISSAGRAVALQAIGQRFDPVILHHFITMFHIFDDTFAEKDLKAVQHWAVSLSDDDTWFDSDQLSFASQLVDMASKYFDLSAMIGCEMHINYDTPNPHKDKDEDAWSIRRELIHPLCSIVYYPLVNVSKGGNLFFPEYGVSIAPRTNRTVIFRSDLLHAGTPCTGIRQSIGINPWDKKPFAYTRA